LQHFSDRLPRLLQVILLSIDVIKHEPANSSEGKSQPRGKIQYRRNCSSVFSGSRTHEAVRLAFGRLFLTAWVLKRATALLRLLLPAYGFLDLLPTRSKWLRRSLRRRIALLSKSLD
jgi:hypothetical protein